jgi:hypothetical protein
MHSPAGAGLAVGAVEQNARCLHSDAVVGAFGHDCKQIERYDADMADGKLSPSLSQLEAVRRERRSTCSIRRVSPGLASDRSRNSAGRASFAPLSFSL